MEIELLDLFPKIRFEQENDKKHFAEYYDSRGHGIYYNAYLVLSTLIPSQDISYQIFADFIRYDKAIRDHLYKYLALYEERLIDYICRNFSYNKREEINYKNLDNLINGKNIFVDNQSFNINLFNNLDLTLGSLFYLIRKFDSKYISETDSKNILKLRNMVMHHNLLLVDVKKVINKTNIVNRHKYIDRLVKVFLDKLSTNYKTSFVDIINYINGKTKSPIKLEIGEINYGLWLCF